MNSLYLSRGRLPSSFFIRLQASSSFYCLPAYKFQSSHLRMQSFLTTSRILSRKLRFSSCIASTRPSLRLYVRPFSHTQHVMDRTTIVPPGSVVVGPYSPATKASGPFVFVSGQIGMDAATGQLVSNPNDDSRNGHVRSQTEQVGVPKLVNKD